MPLLYKMKTPLTMEMDLYGHQTSGILLLGFTSNMRNKDVYKRNLLYLLWDEIVTEHY